MKTDGEGCLYFFLAGSVSLAVIGLIYLPACNRPKVSQVQIQSPAAPAAKSTLPELEPDNVPLVDYATPPLARPIPRPVQVDRVHKIEFISYDAGEYTPPVGYEVVGVAASNFSGHTLLVMLRRARQ